jgi:hypothetical protein
MSNRNLTNTIILRKFIMLVKNQVPFIKKINREFDKDFDPERSNTVYARRPIRWEVKDGAAVQIQDMEQAKVPIVVDQRKHVAARWTSQEKALELPEFVRRSGLDNAAEEMGNYIERSLFELYKDVYNIAGAVNETVNSFTDYLKGPERLDNMAVPRSGRFGLLSVTDYYALVGAQAALGDSNLIEKAWKEADTGRVAGLVPEISQNVYTHTNGTFAGTPKVNNAQSTTYALAGDNWYMDLITDGWSSTSLKQGDRFTIDGVYAINPRTRAALPYLQQFVVKADVSDSSGDMTIRISPPIITSGPYQTVSAAAANNADIVMYGTTGATWRANIIAHRDAFTLVTVPLPRPDDPNVSFTQITDEETGLTFSLEKWRDSGNTVDLWRIDALFGKKTTHPDLASLLNGST